MSAALCVRSRSALANWRCSTAQLQFPKGAPFVINLQPPTREVWLAADRQAWHFRYDGARWIDKKGTGAELFTTLGKLIVDKIGATVAFG